VVYAVFLLFNSSFGLLLHRFKNHTGDYKDNVVLDVLIQSLFY